MLQSARRNLSSKSRSSAVYLPLPSLDAAAFQSKRAINLITAVSIYAALEWLAVAASAYFIALIYHGVFLNIWQIESHYILAATAIATIVFFTSLGLQSFNSIRRQSRTAFLSKGAAAAVFAFSIFLSLIFIAKYSAGYSRITFVLQIIGVVIVVLVVRAIFYSWLQSAIAFNQLEARRVALVGESSQCLMFADRLKAAGIQTIGSFYSPIGRNKGNSNATDQKIRELISDCRSLRLDDVIIIADQEDMSALSDLASAFAELPAGIHIFPFNTLNVLATSQIVQFGNVQTIQLYRPPLSATDLYIKRASDIVFATIGLIVLSPLLLAVAFAIKLRLSGTGIFSSKAARLQQCRN